MHFGYVEAIIMIGNIINPISVLKRVLESVSSIFGWIFTATVVIFSAFVIYFGFYLLYVPAKQHIKPVHFEFKLVMQDIVVPYKLLCPLCI